MSHTPEAVPKSHVPMGSTHTSVVHWFESLQTTGVPTHEPVPLQASDVVQPSPSLHGNPLFS
jgi:hypothetical protein